MTHHFHQRHLRDRVEEMQAQEALRCGQPFAQLVQWNAGRVAGENFVALELRLHRGVQRTFGVGVFVDGLDGQIGFRHAAAFHVGAQAVRRRGDFLRRLELFFVQRTGAIQGRLHVFHLAILQRHLEPLQRRPRGDVATHHARAHHVHVFNAVLDAGALVLEALAEEKDADEVLRCRRFGQLGDGTRFQFQPLTDIRPTALPHVDQGERRGVVFLAHFRGRLLQYHRRQDLAYWPEVAGPGLGASCQRARGGATHHMARLGQQFAGAGQAVDHAQVQGAAGGQGFACQHQRQGVGRANQPWQARGAAPAGMNAQLHFGQGDAGFFVVDRDALAAGQDQFGAAAHAGAVHGRHRGTGQARQRFVDALAVLDVFQHGVVLRIVDEGLDVGAHRKPRGLGRMDDDAGRLLDRQPFDDQFEFVQYRAGNRVDAAVGTVESQRDDAVVAFAGLPVVEAQSFEHGRYGHEGEVRTIPSCCRDCEM